MAVGSRVAGTAVVTQAESRAWPQVRARHLVIAGALALVILLGAFLRFYQLGAYSVGNAYYAATVKSMLTSWPNFFFAAYEPGGSVTVDKPPLGFWVQAVSAYFLGVNGLALALPQALAGVLSIPLLFALVRRQFGAGAGLAAALALAVTPVTVATKRNNTIDGLLVFVLLLAAGFALVFGLVHWPQGLLGVVATAIAGFLLAILFLARGSLLPPLVAHYAVNVLQIVLAARQRAVLEQMADSNG